MLPVHQLAMEIHVTFRDGNSVDILHLVCHRLDHAMTKIQERHDSNLRLCFSTILGRCRKSNFQERPNIFWLTLYKQRQTFFPNTCTFLSLKNEQF